VFDPSEASAEKLIEAVRSAGYDAVLPHAGVDIGKIAAAKPRNAEAKAIVTLVAGALAMLFSMPLAAEMGPVDHFLSDSLPWLFQIPHEILRWSLLAITAVLMIWAGKGIYSAAAAGLRRGTTNMNTLVSLGTGVAFLYSAYAAIAPAPGREFYFDAVLLI